MIELPFAYRCHARREGLLQQPDIAGDRHEVVAELHELGALPRVDAEPPGIKLGLSSSSGPRASRSLMRMSERDARGPEEHEHLSLIGAASSSLCRTA